MADRLVSQVSIPGDTNVYLVTDADAQSKITSLQSTVAGVAHFRGTTTTTLSDGASTRTISISGANYTAQTGDIVIGPSASILNKPQEFIYNGSIWQEIGSTSSLKKFATADTGTVTVSDMVEGFTDTPSFQGSTSTATGTYQTISAINSVEFTGQSLTSTGDYVPAGKINFIVNNDNLQPVETITYTPSGGVTSDFTGNEVTIVSSGINLPTGSQLPATYTPAGTVAAPNISLNVVGSTTPVSKITSNTTVTSAKTIRTAAPTVTPEDFNEVIYYDVQGENLNLYHIGYDTVESSKVQAEDRTVKISDGEYVADAPAFTGQQARFTASYVPSGIVSSTWEGNSFTVSSRFTGTSKEVSVSGTPAGTVKSIGAAENGKITFTTTAPTITVTGVPQGTLKNMELTKTAHSFTVSPNIN